MRSSSLLVTIAAAFALATPAWAGVTISPFASVSSTKSINPSKNKGEEKVKTKQRNTYGIKGAISVFRLFKLEASVGQNKLTTVEKTQDVADEFDEIDYEKDANVSTDDPEAEVKTIETQRIARVGIALDPSFSIFILRAKAGAQGTQRLLRIEQNGVVTKDLVPPITYKPYAGAGAGIKIGAKMNFMIEYTLFLYKFPEIEPFGREVSVAYGMNF